MIRKTQIFLALFCFLTVAASAQLTPKDLTRLVMTGGGSLSPDGTKIAYIKRVQRDLEAKDFKNGGAYAELWVMDTKGKSRPFVSGKVNVSRVRWSKDGSELTFLTKRGKDKHTSLYAIPIDGGEARQLVSFPTSVQDYALGPNGRRIAFIANEPVSKDREKMKKKGFDQRVVEEDVRFNRVYVTTRGADNSELKPLDLKGSASELRWSPVGDTLVAAFAPNPSVDAYYMYRRMQVFNSRGQLLARIDNPGKLGHVEFSPDGRRIAFQSAVNLNDPHNGHLYLADPKTGKFRDLTPNLKGQIDSYSWSSANEVVAAVSIGSFSQVERISMNGKRSKLAYPPINYTSVSARGKNVVATADSPKHPSEIFYNGRRLTNSNPWLKSRALARQEVITYKARDGLEIEGILMYPLNNTQNNPLILTVHGGPESHYNNGWLSYYSTPGQVAAAKGYAVFYPNYRGSTGRGVPFATSSQADPAGKEFDDLVDGVEHLVNMGLVDRKKVGITGGSYGGYASAWGATYFTKHFAASVMFVGISDKVSKVGTTDIPDEEFLVHARKRPWDNFEFFMKRSPIFYVKQARTPILIMHGADDPRVHPTQSMELFRFLKSLGQTPVRLVLYPGEGHGNRKAAGRYDYSLRLLRWMDHYLKGPGGDPPPMEIDYQLKK